MRELPIFVNRGNQLTTTERTETAFGKPVVPLRVEFSMQRSSVSRKQERPCELQIDHVIFVQSLLCFLDKTVFLGTPFLPQQNLAEVDGAVDIAKHLMELLRLMGIIGDNDMPEIG